MKVIVVACARSGLKHRYRVTPLGTTNAACRVVMQGTKTREIAAGNIAYANAIFKVARQLLPEATGQTNILAYPLHTRFGKYCSGQTYMIVQLINRVAANHQ